MALVSSLFEAEQVQVHHHATEREIERDWAMADANMSLNRKSVDLSWPVGSMNQVACCKTIYLYQTQCLFQQAKGPFSSPSACEYIYIYTHVYMCICVSKQLSPKPRKHASSTVRARRVSLSFDFEVQPPFLKASRH